VIALSVNVNKVATLRNSRGGSFPSVLDAVSTCIAAGAPGITVHPRADERHITARDVREIAAYLKAHPQVELNIEGDPRVDWLSLVAEVRPTQATLVPVRPGEITSEAGWRPNEDTVAMIEIVAGLRARGIRVSVFVDPELPAIEWAKRVGADRVELYTEPFARAFTVDAATCSVMLDRYVRAAEHAHGLGLGINAGHDLDLDNLRAFKKVPHLDEVSIGHALIGRAVFEGLSKVVREYLDVLRS
jgi:pyridoxine 5-phosphate synthase